VTKPAPDVVASPTGLAPVAPPLCNQKMTSPRRLASTFVGATMFLGLAAGAARPARACSCAEMKLIAPASGERDVPPDTKLWYVDEYHRKPGLLFRLTGPEGEVPLQTIPLGSGSYVSGHLSTPEAELTPGATYRFAVCPTQLSCTDLSVFTVGDRRAEKPRLPVETGERSEYYSGADYGSSCGDKPERFAILTFDWEGLLLVVDVASQNPYPADPAAVLHQATTAEEIRRMGGVRIGAGACANNWVRGLADAPDTAPVRFGAVNLAGQFSDWTAPTTINLPEGCTCTVGSPGAAASSLWITGPLALVLLYRRRRRRR
jgi:MYXO-CTERM domain-containing protein